MHIWACGICALQIIALLFTEDNIITGGIMGLLQLAVTWYMLEGKLPTGTSKTKKIQIYLHEVALFWMSQWAACPPACTMWPVAAKGPLLLWSQKMFSVHMLSAMWQMWKNWTYRRSDGSDIITLPKFLALTLPEIGTHGAPQAFGAELR